MDGDIFVVCHDVVEAPLKPFVTVCAWCKRELGRRWTTNGGVSHGICDDCRAQVMKDREGKEGGDNDEVSASGKKLMVKNVERPAGARFRPSKLEAC